MRYIFGAFCAFLLSISCASAQEMTVQIGDENITLPAAEGYVEVASKDDEFKNIFKTFVPPTNILHAGYISQADQDAINAEEEPLFETYLMVQSIAQAQKYLNMSDFAELRDKASGEFEKIWSRIEKDAEKTAEKNLKETTGQDADIKIDGMQVVDRFSDTDSSLCFEILTGYKSEIDGVQDSAPVLNTTCFLLLKNRVVMSYAFKKYQGEQDKPFLKSFAEKWTADMLRLNPSSAEERSYGDSSGGGSPWWKTLLIGAIAAVLGGLIYKIFRRR